MLDSGHLYDEHRQPDLVLRSSQAWGGAVLFFPILLMKLKLRQACPLSSQWPRNGTCEMDGLFAHSLSIR